MKKRKKKDAKPPEIRKITRDEWLEEGKRLFGDDMKLWRFVCSNCGNVQTVKDFLELTLLGIFKRDPGTVVYFSCIGRFDTRIPDHQIGGIGEDKRPCNYTLGGLFCLAKTFVLMDGKENPVFEFDKTAAPLIENEKSNAGAHDPDLQSSPGGSDEKKAI